MKKTSKKPAAKIQPKPSNVIALPPDWKSAFQGHAIKSSFCLALTQPMLEFLCATADDVHWDRLLYYRQYGNARPDSFIASEAALEKRGLIVRKIRTVLKEIPVDEAYLHSYCELTPAGVAVVELLKVAGIFIEADAAIEKRSRTVKS